MPRDPNLRSPLKDHDNIKASAVLLMETLSTPINGQPTITVHNEPACTRLLSAFIDEIWSMKLKENT